MSTDNTQKTEALRQRADWIRARPHPDESDYATAALLDEAADTLESQAYLVQQAREIAVLLGTENYMVDMPASVRSIMERTETWHEATLAQLDRVRSRAALLVSALQAAPNVALKAASQWPDEPGAEAAREAAHYIAHSLQVHVNNALADER